MKPYLHRIFTEAAVVTGKDSVELQSMATTIFASMLHHALATPHRPIWTVMTMAPFSVEVDPPRTRTPIQPGEPMPSRERAALAFALQARQMLGWIGELLPKSDEYLTAWRHLCNLVDEIQAEADRGGQRPIDADESEAQPAAPSELPADDDRATAGMAWWNALSAPERAAKLQYTARVLGRAASVGDAWAIHNNRLPKVIQSTGAINA
jgi:hypothetical protein